MIKLDNHRLLKANETIRKGDFYKTLSTGKIFPVAHSIGRTPPNGYCGYEFYRRKHTKKVVTPAPQRSVAVNQPVAKYPTVSFKYNGAYREVQVIKLDDKYLSGLEVNYDTEKPKYQFKKFLRSRIQTAVHLVKLADN